MGLFFVNCVPVNSGGNPRRRWVSILIEQIINASIVGGIAGISVIAVVPAFAWKAAGIAFGITFLIELRKYRKL